MTVLDDFLFFACYVLSLLLLFLLCFGYYVVIGYHVNMLLLSLLLSLLLLLLLLLLPMLLPMLLLLLPLLRLLTTRKRKRDRRHHL